MKKVKDISGQKFGRLTAIKFLRIEKHKAVWLCKCECGNLLEVRGTDLTKGHTKSCGCLRKESCGNNNKTHDKSNTRLYSIWCDIKKRCYNLNCKSYKNYGGRGIKVCDVWCNDFMNFYNWAMSHNYNDTLTIDRIDVNGNYEPNNCRWSTAKQQARNKRNNRYITINGETHCLSEWCEFYNIPVTRVECRLNKLGWSITEALELEERK